ncbi:ATP-grasp domain-containing protein [Eionea flava]
MNILLLLQSLDNLTAINLIQAFKQTGHNIEVVPYYQDNKEQVAVINRGQLSFLKHQSILHNPKDYDAAVLWCWGTAALGRKYLKIFEDQGVWVLNSINNTAITDSKTQFAKALIKNNIATPKTCFFDTRKSEPSYLDIVKKLGAPPYVLKHDYGTQGKGVQFFHNQQEFEGHLNTFLDLNKEGGKFIVQEFIGNPNKPIYHYRVIVIGNQAFPIGRKTTAKSPMTISNFAAGSATEFFHVNSGLLMNTALEAAKISGLNVSGVDLMEYEYRGQQHVVVLEVNDGPGTKTFDQHGHHVSQAIADYVIHELSLIS